ncbi:MAG: chorismate mutase [Longimicrobiales bacterium]|nr:chorismate mutase [Longimicrobiales bacterium]
MTRGGPDRDSPEDLGAELESLRRQVDEVDRSLVEAFALRVRIALRIGEVKEALGQPVLDPGREAAVVRRAAERAREAGLDEEAVREVFWRLVGLSRRTQREERGGAHG